MKLIRSTLLILILLSSGLTAWAVSSPPQANSVPAVTNTALVDTAIEKTAQCSPDIPCAPDLPWSLLLYRGVTTENTLGQIFGMHYTTGKETIYSLELAHELAYDNPLRHYLQPIVSTVEVAGNVAYRDDSTGPIYEFDPYLIFRWQNFPWCRYLNNSMALGWGVSYVTSIPSWERRDSSNTKKLLNYLMFEVTFALPRYPQWELALRLHHRSGMFGLYGADNAGSTAIGVGIGYRF